MPSNLIVPNIDYICYAAPNVPSIFPNKLPTAEQTYALNIEAMINPLVDVPVSGTVEVAPAGAGELEVTAFTYSNFDLTVTVESGQPSRVYTYLFNIETIAGLTYTFQVEQGIPKVLCTDTAQPAPIAGFGAPMSWTSPGPTLLVATGLVGIGNAQISALLLPAYTNIISSVPSGTGFILNGAFVGGNIV